jgi:hypothetical protein
MLSERWSKSHASVSLNQINRARKLGTLFPSSLPASRTPVREGYCDPRVRVIEELRQPISLT